MRIVQVIMRTQLDSTFTVYVHIFVGLKFLKSDLTVRLTQLHFVHDSGGQVYSNQGKFILCVYFAVLYSEYSQNFLARTFACICYLENI